jgi:mannose-6-phosphate isomerase-like protein (cupin superfamily)
MLVGNLADAAPFTTKDGSTIREVAGPVSAATEHQSLAEARVPPGGATTAHVHHRSEELYFFTGGAGRIRLGDEERDVRPGECVVIPPGTPHKLFNTSAAEDLVLLCCCAPPYSDADTELLEPEVRQPAPGA